MDNKNQLTDEERIELARKLDEELDEFIDGLEKRQYTEGWPEDKWEEEFNKHPFFMKEPPKVGDELHPLLEGLQQLKYDPEENTAEELAERYREDGNFNIQHKNYRLAILSYTEGLKQKHNNEILTSMLFNNRAVANYYLKNYRSCINDCKKCLNINPQHKKAKLRLAKSYLHLNYFDESFKTIDEILEKDPLDIELRELLKTINQKKAAFDKEIRKKNKKQSLKQRDDEQILRLITEKQIKFNNLTPKIPQLESHKVHISECGSLIWPVLFLYPEKGQMDFIEQFSEETTLFEQLTVILNDQANWDNDFEYKINNVNIYFKEINTNIIHSVDINAKLEDILTRKEYTVQDGTPCFFVVVKNSKYEQHFLKQCN